MKQVLTIKETVARSKECGMPISEYTLRRALNKGAIPCRIVGRTYLILWSNVENWLLCKDGGDKIGTAEDEICQEYANGAGNTQSFPVASVVDNGKPEFVAG